MLEMPMFICPSLSDVMTNNRIKTEDLIKEIQWPDIKIILNDPYYKISYSKIQNLVSVLNKLKPAESEKITAENLDYWFPVRNEYMNAKLQKIKLYICPLLNKVRTKLGLTMKDLANKTGWSIEILRKVLYDRPDKQAGRYYPISYNDMQSLIDALNKLKPAKYEKITAEDLDEGFQLRHKYILEVMAKMFKTYFDEIIFDWLTDLGDYKAMQIAKYFDVYDTIDDLTARIAYCFAHMDNKSKIDLKQKMFSISLNDMIYYVTANCKYIDSLMKMRSIIADKTLTEIIETELKKINKLNDNKIEKVMKVLLIRISNKLDVDINNKIYLNEFESMLSTTAKSSNADIKSIIKRNSEVYTEEQRAEDFDNAFDVEEANKFIWRMNLFTSEDCEDVDVWDLIIACSLLYDQDKPLHEQAYLLECLKYAEELFKQSCKLEDVKKAYLPLEF